MKYKNRLLILPIAWMLAACNAIPTPIASAPTQVRTTRAAPTGTNAPATPTNAPSPTNAPATSASTLTPVVTLAPNPFGSAGVAPTLTRVATSASGVFPLPVGAPMSEWHNFPVMPNALAGQDKDKAGYYYTVPATPQQVQEFYTREMKNLGWDLLSVTTRISDPGYLALIYRQANYPTFTVLVNMQGGVAVVYLAN